MTTEGKREPVSNVWGTPPPPGSSTLKVTPSYGGAWQEFRAYLALVLFGWAQSVHFGCTVDMARALTAMEEQAWADALADVSRQAQCPAPDNASCDIPDARQY